MEGLSEFLLDADYGRCLLSTNIETIWEYLRNLVHDGIHPYKVTIKANHHPKCFTRNIRHLIKYSRSIR